MPVDVTRTLRAALAGLEAEKVGVVRQIAAIKGVLDSSGAPRGRGGQRGRGRPPMGGSRRMSTAARKAVGRRMKAYWAKRKAAAKKGKK